MMGHDMMMTVPTWEYWATLDYWVTVAVKVPSSPGFIEAVLTELFAMDEEGRPPIVTRTKAGTRMVVYLEPKQYFDYLTRTSLPEYRERFAEVEELQRSVVWKLPA